MKNLYIAIVLIFCATGLYAQSTEFFVLVNSGVSGFTGKGTVNNTFLNTNADTHAAYANGTGNSLAATYGVSVQGQQVLKNGLIFGLQTGFDVFSGRTNIDYSQTDASGHTTAHYYYVNINPYVGYRLNIGKTKLDLMPGADVACGTGSSYAVNAYQEGVYYNKSSYPQYTPPTEVRVKFGAALYYHRFGITASYAYGLKNMNSNVYYDYLTVPSALGAYNQYVSYTSPSSIHEQLYRLGVLYRIK